jgi:hypothetical protein
MATREERLREAEVVIAASSAAALRRAVEVSWGGVWSGFLVGIGAIMMLGSLGLAIGLTLSDFGPTIPGEPSNAAEMWMLGSLLMSLFIAGFAAARLGVVLDRATGALQGMLVWVLAMLAMTLLGAGVMGLGGWRPLDVLDTAVVRAPAPPLLPGIETGNVDAMILSLQDPATAAHLAELTGRPLREVTASLALIRQRVEANRSDPARAVAEAQDGLQRLMLRDAPEVERQLTTGAWIAFGMLVVTLLSAVLGGLTGARRLPIPA